MGLVLSMGKGTITGYCYNQQMNTLNSTKVKVISNSDTLPYII